MKDTEKAYFDYGTKLDIPEALLENLKKLKEEMDNAHYGMEEFAKAMRDRHKAIFKEVKIIFPELEAYDFGIDWKEDKISIRGKSD